MKSLAGRLFLSRRAEATTAAVSIPVISAALYLCALIGRAKASVFFDRYCLLILPLLIIGILAVWQNCGLQSPGLVARVVAIVFGIYGVAITHDHFQQMRARVHTLKVLEEANIPREHMEGGMEDDMWTQVALDG